MTIQPGEAIPEAKLMQATAEGPKEVTTSDLFGGKTVVLFGVPGAFTPTCSARHLPGYVERADEFKKRGYGLVCIAVNDAFVMDAWAKSQNVPDDIQLLADGNADFAKERCIVIGISPDDCLTHADFRDEHGLSVELLADEEGEVCKLYGVWQSEMREGVMKRGVRRSTFIISSDGVLRHVLHDVNPRGHAAEVFQLVKQLNSRKLNGNRQKHGRHA